MPEVVKAVMKMIAHIEASSTETIDAVEVKAQAFVADELDKFGSSGATQWDGISLKIHLNLTFPVSDPSSTTIVVDDASKLIGDLVEEGLVSTGQVETEYAAYDPAAAE